MHVNGGEGCLVLHAHEIHVFTPTTLKLAAGSGAAYGRHDIERVSLEETPRRMSGGGRGSEAQPIRPAVLLWDLRRGGLREGLAQGKMPHSMERPAR